MATKSTRSAGSQFTDRGITQGTTLVGQKSGLPIDEVVDVAGTRRLAVDANISAQSIQVSVDLDPDDDGVFIGDPDNGNTLEILPDGSINSNVEVDAADGDNIAIHDSQGDELAINPDGSINVSVTSSNPGTIKSFYNEVTSVATAILTPINTYTAPVGKISYLQQVEISGTNIAEYTIEINSIIKAKKRTYFGSNLDIEFIFALGSIGLPLIVGDIITIKVIHNRPNLGDFDARIQVVEI